MNRKMKYALLTVALLTVLAAIVVSLGGRLEQSGGQSTPEPEKPESAAPAPAPEAPVSETPGYVIVTTPPSAPVPPDAPAAVDRPEAPPPPPEPEPMPEPEPEPGTAGDDVVSGFLP